jgi:hypothetical protein
MPVRCLRCLRWRERRLRRLLIGDREGSAASDIAQAFDTTAPTRQTSLKARS